MVAPILHRRPGSVFPTSGKPIVLFFPFGYLSHYLRCIVLAREFRTDYECQFLDNPNYRGFLEKEGILTFSCSSWDAMEILQKVEGFDFSWLSESLLERHFLARVAAINKYQPAAVIGDNDPALKMAAEATGVEYVSLVNGYMSKYFTGTRTLSKRHPTYVWMRWLPPGLRNNLIRVGEKLSMRAIHQPFKVVREKHGLPRYQHYLDELKGDLNIICDPPELFPQSKLPWNYDLKGPLIYDDPGIKSLKGVTDPEKKTLFVNMGSAGDWRKVQFLIDPYYTRYNIITAGDTAGILKGVATANYSCMPAADILPFTDLVICHGGNGTIHQCRKYGVPMLCCPSYFEQEWNADAVEKVGWGRSIDGINDPLSLQKVVKEWIAKR